MSETARTKRVYRQERNETAPCRQQTGYRWNQRQETSNTYFPEESFGKKKGGKKGKETRPKHNHILSCSFVTGDLLNPIPYTTTVKWLMSNAIEGQTLKWSVVVNGRFWNSWRPVLYTKCAALQFRVLGPPGHQLITKDQNSWKQSFFSQFWG